MKSQRQKIGENLDEFEARLVHLAYPNALENIMEYLAVQVCVDGIRNKEIHDS